MRNLVATTYHPSAPKFPSRIPMYWLPQLPSALLQVCQSALGILMRPCFGSVPPNGIPAHCVVGVCTLVPIPALAVALPAAACSGDTTMPKFSCRNRQTVSKATFPAQGTWGIRRVSATGTAVPNTLAGPGPNWLAIKKRLGRSSAGGKSCTRGGSLGSTIAAGMTFPS